MTILAVALCGCGNGGGNGSGIAPGTARVVSINEIHLAGADVSDYNGDFSEWWAGAPTPTGFLAPNAAQSTLARVDDAHGDGFAVKQVWARSDMDRPFQELFRTTLDLQPSTLYRVEVAVTTEDRRKVHVGIPNPAGDPVNLPLITTEEYPGLFRWYSANATSDADGRLTLVTFTDGPASVIWHTWRVRPEDGQGAEIEEELRPIYAALSTKLQAANTLILTEGTPKELAGWVCGDEQLDIIASINGRSAPVKLVERPDVVSKFPRATQCQGWMLKLDELAAGGSHLLEIHVNGKLQHNLTVKVEGSAAAGPLETPAPAGE